MPRDHIASQRPVGGLRFTAAALERASEVVVGRRIRGREFLAGFIQTVPRVKEKLKGIPEQDHDFEGERSNEV